MFCAYSYMRPIVHHIEKYSNEKLFDKNYIKFLSATRITWLVRGGFDYYRMVSESKLLLFKLLENWKVFEIRNAAMRTTIPAVSRRAFCYETLCSSMSCTLPVALHAL